VADADTIPVPPIPPGELPQVYPYPYNTLHMWVVGPVGVNLDTLCPYAHRENQCASVHNNHETSTLGACFVVSVRAGTCVGGRAGGRAGTDLDTLCLYAHGEN
jgi:hypothetical protein